MFAFFIILHIFIFFGLYYFKESFALRILSVKIYSTNYHRLCRSNDPTTRTFPGVFGEKRKAGVQRRFKKRAAKHCSVSRARISVWSSFSDEKGYFNVNERTTEPDYCEITQSNKLVYRKLWIHCKIVHLETERSKIFCNPTKLIIILNPTNINNPQILAF